MGARALASATISFGLVSIPVKLFTTQESGANISFNMLHSCGSRIKQQTYCPRCETVVQRSELLKGYAFAKDQYVTFEPDELKALEEQGSRSVDIAEFIPIETIDPLFYEKSYFLGPDKGGDRPYQLLATAMRQTGRAALARYAARGKQYLVLIRPFEEGLILQQLFYPDEIRSFEDVERGGEAVKDAELKLAIQLIEQIAKDEFDPAPYHDAVKNRLEEAIQRKIDGEEHIAVSGDETPQGQIIDLMEALKASLGDGKGEADDGDKRRGPKRSSARAAGSEEQPAPKARRRRAAKQ
jgi:DNA end-binding protein Ku